MRGRTVRNPVLLRKAQDRGHAASHLASGDLPAQEIGQLLVQGNRRVVVEHVPELTSPVSTHVRWGLPVCTREYTWRHDRSSASASSWQSGTRRFCHSA